jgi:hypothetical protein
MNGSFVFLHRLQLLIHTHTLEKRSTYSPKVAVKVSGRSKFRGYVLEGIFEQKGENVGFSFCGSCPDFLQADTRAPERDRSPGISS